MISTHRIFENSREWKCSAIQAAHSLKICIINMNICFIFWKKEKIFKEIMHLFHIFIRALSSEPLTQGPYNSQLRKSIFRHHNYELQVHLLISRRRLLRIYAFSQCNYRRTALSPDPRTQGPWKSQFWKDTLSHQDCLLSSSA